MEAERLKGKRIQYELKVRKEQEVAFHLFLKQLNAVFLNFVDQGIVAIK
jgi:hypothetical protein